MIKNFNLDDKVFFVTHWLEEEYGYGFVNEIKKSGYTVNYEGLNIFLSESAVYRTEEEIKNVFNRVKMKK